MEQTELYTNKNFKLNFLEIINKEIGIKNIGNTFYINSIIQILIHNKLFMKNFILKKGNIKVKKK